MKRILLSCLLLPSLVFAQDDLIKKIEGNKSDSNKYVFTVVKNIENTYSIKIEPKKIFTTFKRNKI